MFHDQGSAVIMVAHSTCGVYAGCNIQVLGKKSHVKITMKERSHCLHGAYRLLLTLDIPSVEALEWRAAVSPFHHWA